MQVPYYFPYRAIIGQEAFKLCLQLNCIDPSIGGVLATGDKGTGKTTIVRALSQFMGASFPFVNLPIGASEDRVLGSINLEALINQKKTIIDSGLLTKAHGGFLYIDEVNLLNDYLMDILLDAAASGGYHLEREGISQWQDSRFCLVGTMNPEEGMLRPQLLDRFGLSVSIKTPQDAELRKQIVKNRLAFDADPVGFYKQFEEEEQQTKQRILAARSRCNTIPIPESVREAAVNLTLSHNVEGMRADILLLKAVRAYAAYLEKDIVTDEMLQYVAPYVLQHRSNSYSSPDDKKEQHTDESITRNEEEQLSQEQEKEFSSFQLPKAVQKGLTLSVEKPTKKKEIKITISTNAQPISYTAETQRGIDIFKSVKYYVTKNKFLPIAKPYTNKTMVRIIFLVDTSASMIIHKQLGYVKGIIEKTIVRHPLKKIQYAVIGLEGTTSRIIQGFTADVNHIIQTSYTLRAGGKTNLGSAFLNVYELIKSLPARAVQLFVLTDGKINAGAKEPFRYAVSVYQQYLKKMIKTTIVDTESGFVRLGMAKRLAEQLHVSYITMDNV